MIISGKLTDVTYFHSNLKEEDTGGTGTRQVWVPPDIEMKHEEEDIVLEVEETQLVTRKRLTEVFTQLNELNASRTAAVRDQKLLLEAMKAPLSLESVVSHVNRISQAEAFVARMNKAIKRAKERISKLQGAIDLLSRQKAMADAVAQAEKELEELRKNFVAGEVGQGAVEGELGGPQVDFEKKVAEVAHLMELQRQLKAASVKPQKKAKAITIAEGKKKEVPLADAADGDMKLVEELTGSVRGRSTKSRGRGRGRGGNKGTGTSRVRINYALMDEESQEGKRSM